MASSGISHYLFRNVVINPINPREEKPGSRNYNYIVLVLYYS